jgi:PAS domain S-box-containing protein
MLGYSPDEIDDILQQGIDLQHPDDRGEAWKAVQAHLDGKTDSYSIEYRMRTKSGKYKWIRDCGKIMARDELGHPLRVCGTHADIDEQKRAGERIKGLLSEKELLLKEVHHRIKNNMNTISSLLSIQAGTVTDPGAIAALEDAGRRIQSMSVLYDKLYRSISFTELSFAEYVSSLVDEVVANFPNCRSVMVRKNLEDFLLDAKRLQTLGIVVNELLTNTMKYAFKGRAHGLVTVAAAAAGDSVVISIQDDGIGMPESVSFENSTGFGLQLVNALAQQLGGTIHIERGNGTKIVLEFKK